MYTFSDLIHKYADDVRSGSADTDLSKREAAVVAVYLHTAGNLYQSKDAYPPTAERRDRVIRDWGNICWDGNASAFVEAAAPRLDIDKCRSRAADILSNI